MFIQPPLTYIAPCTNLGRNLNFPLVCLRLICFLSTSYEGTNGATTPAAEKMVIKNEKLVIPVNALVS